MMARRRLWSSRSRRCTARCTTPTRRRAAQLACACACLAALLFALRDPERKKGCLHTAAQGWSREAQLQRRLTQLEAENATLRRDLARAQDGVALSVSPRLATDPVICLSPRTEGAAPLRRAWPAQRCVGAALTRRRFALSRWQRSAA